MKTKNLLSVLAIMALCFNVASCSKPIEETPEEMEQAPKKAVSITTRSVSNATIEYPITLYAFNANGTLAASVTAEEADDALEMLLAVGKYNIVAIAGATGWTIQEPITASSIISMPESNEISSPLQLGNSEYEVTASKLIESDNVEIALEYKVAKVSVNLTDIPTEVTKASVTLSPMYSSTTVLGEFDGSEPITINLTQDQTTKSNWSSNSMFTLPGVEGEALELIITITNGTVTKSFSYSPEITIEGGSEYIFSGSYLNSVSLTGSITAAGWNDAVEKPFNFGFGDAISGEKPENTNGVYEIEGDFPEARTIWEGHFVANITYNDNKNADLLLISLEEWSDITQSTASITAEYVINSYVENGIKNWRVPTSTELTTIFQAFYNSSIDAVNGKLQNDLSGKKITGDAFYLCDETTKAIKPGDSKKVLGLTTSDIYHLRLVKTVKVKKVATN